MFTLSMLHHTITPLIILALLGCGSKTSEPAAGSGSAGSGSSYAALGHKPANARRPTPPPEIDKTALAVGATVPAVELVDAASGNPWKLSDAFAKTERVIVVFYRGDWCPHCRRQLGELQRKLPALDKAGLGLAAISVDEVPPGKALVAKLKLTFRS